MASISYQHQHRAHAFAPDAIEVHRRPRAWLRLVWFCLGALIGQVVLLGVLVAKWGPLP